MVWYGTFDAVFFITIATLLTGTFGLLIKYCLKSKCENIDFCFGLIRVKRRVDLEIKEEMARIDNNLELDSISSQPKDYRKMTIEEKI